jgi:hypothetical protein
MAYATVSEVKAYLGIATASDDTLLNDLVSRAQSIIDNYTGRVFEAETAIRYYTRDDVDGAYLLFYGDDLLSVTTLTNGNGEVIASANYRLEPRNATPKYSIKLLNGVYWEFDDSNSEISVAGLWGYTATPPGDIAHACVRLTAFLYRQKDTSADIDRPLVTGDGVTIMPSGLPQDVKSLLDKYKRRIV